MGTRPAKLVVGGVCKNGHRLTTETLGVNNDETHFCKPCKMDTERRYRHNPDNAEKMREKYLRANANRRARNKLYKEQAEMMAMNNPVVKQFYEALDGTATPCTTIPLDLMGYNPWTDYDEDKPPSSNEAREMCAGCPLLAQCGAAAIAMRPYHGVWAGMVFVDGKRKRG